MLKELGNGWWRPHTNREQFKQATIRTEYPSDRRPAAQSEEGGRETGKTFRRRF